MIDIVRLSRFDTDISRRGAHGDRIEASARGGRSPRARRLRAVSGPQGASRAQLAAAAGSRGLDRGGRPDARASRSLRLSAAAGRAGLPGRIFCTPATAELTRIVLADAAQAAGRRRRARQPQGLHQAPARAAALHDGGRGAARWRCCSRSATSGRCPSCPASPRSSSTPGICSARLRARARRGDRQDDSLWRRSRPLRPARAARSVARRPTPTSLLVESTYGDRVHEADDDGTRLARHHQRHRASAAARSSFRRSRSAASRSCSTGFNGSRRATPDSRAAGLRRQSDGGGGARRSIASALDELDPEIAQARGPAVAGAHVRRATAVRVLHGEAQGRDVDSRVARGAGIHDSRRSSSPSSGMATGGRVLHHLARALPDPTQHRALCRLSGGRHARAGSSRTARKFTRIHGQDVPVRARNRGDRLDVGARRLRTRSCGGCAGFTRPPAAHVPRPRRAGARWTR